MTTNELCYVPYDMNGDNIRPLTNMSGTYVSYNTAAISIPHNSEHVFIDVGTSCALYELEGKFKQLTAEICALREAVAILSGSVIDLDKLQYKYDLIFKK